MSLFSMTGFGSADGHILNSPVRIDIKTLNHRFLDLKFRLPRRFQILDQNIRQFFNGKLHRGSVEIKLDFLDKLDSKPEEMTKINHSLAAHYYEATVSLSKTLGITNNVNAYDLLKLPDVITSPSEEEQTTKLWKQFEPILEKALANLQASRLNEGKALGQILESHISEIKNLHTQLSQKRKVNLEQYNTKTKERVQAIFDAYPIAQTQTLLETRVAQEIALLVDRTDITEELDRLEHHLKSFTDILKKGGQTGKRLEFLTQELGREINTLGNKSQDFTMSDLVIEAKVKNEQIREQILNLE